VTGNRPVPLQRQPCLPHKPTHQADTGTVKIITRNIPGLAILTGLIVWLIPTARPALGPGR
jgi:hypothetical protein